MICFPEFCFHFHFYFLFSALEGSGVFFFFLLMQMKYNKFKRRWKEEKKKTVYNNIVLCTYPNVVDIHFDVTELMSNLYKKIFAVQLDTQREKQINEGKKKNYWRRFAEFVITQVDDGIKRRREKKGARVHSISTNIHLMPFRWRE